MKWRPKNIRGNQHYYFVGCWLFLEELFITPDTNPSKDLSVWKESFLCSKLSKSVYSNHENGELEKQLKQLGFSRVATIERDGLRVCVCQDDNQVAVVFRGSDNLRNWITNLKIASKPVKSGSVHSGFHHSTMKFYEEIKREISEGGGENKRLIVTGHQSWRRDGFALCVRSDNSE